MPDVMLLHDSPDGSYVETRRARLRDRLAVRLHARALDRALAAGARSDASVPLALRAEWLCRDSHRRHLAARVRELVDEIDRPSGRFIAQPALCWRKIRLSRRELVALSDRLLLPGPVAVVGVARTRVLLENGVGPLYDRPLADDLGVAAESAMLALDPWGTVDLGLGPSPEERT